MVGRAEEADSVGADTMVGEAEEVEEAEAGVLVEEEAAEGVGAVVGAVVGVEVVIGPLSELSGYPLYM